MTSQIGVETKVSRLLSVGSRLFTHFMSRSTKYLTRAPIWIVSRSHMILLKHIYLFFEVNRCTMRLNVSITLTGQVSSRHQSSMFVYVVSAWRTPDFIIQNRVLTRARARVCVCVCLTSTGWREGGGVTWIRLWSILCQNRITYVLFSNCTLITIIINMNKVHNVPKSIDQPQLPESLNTLKIQFIDGSEIDRCFEDNKN